MKFYQGKLFNYELGITASEPFDLGTGKPKFWTMPYEGLEIWNKSDQAKISDQIDRAVS